MYLVVADGFAQPSIIFNEGKWCKIGVVSSGVYKLTYKQIEDAGVNLKNVKSSQISLTGHGGGGILPQVVTTNVVGRPEPVSIFVEDHQDGSFDKNDFLLFHGNTSNRIDFIEEELRFEYEKNIYSDTTFYFLTITQENNPRVEQIEFLNPSQAKTDAYTCSIHELDVFNMLNSGREWYGENFSRSNNFQDIDFSLGVGQFLDGKLEVEVMASSLSESTFEVSLENIGSVGSLKIPAKTSGDKTKGFEENSLFDVASGFGGTVNLTFSTNDANGFGLLDRLVLTSRSKISYAGQTIAFTLPSTASVSTFSIQKFESDLQIWDVTNPIHPKVMKTNSAGSFNYFSEKPTDYIVFKTDQVMIPSAIKPHKISQYIRSQSNPVLLIVTYDPFLPQAIKLAQHRSTQQGFTTSVVPISEIFNEYGSGIGDVTALRNFIYDTYQRGALKYVLLFGDASFDYKKRILPDNNFVPTYQSRNSLTESFTYGSDDFYGFLEVGEGEWEEGLSGDHTMDVSVGRLPVKTKDEAKIIVDKLIQYDQSSPWGTWRMQSLFSADDGDFNIHQGDADKIAEEMFNQNVMQQPSKLYVDDFTQTAGVSLDANQAFFRKIHDGQLIVNYLGHGNEVQLASEILFTDYDLPFWHNTKLPFFVTLTCDFGVFDNPLWFSTGERLLLQSEYGAIGLVTATRTVLSSTNFQMNKSFNSEVFKREGGKYQSIGEVFNKVKNSNLKGRLNRSYALLADPSMTLNYSQLNLKTDSIVAKGNSLDSGFYTNQLIQLYGSVTNEGHVMQNDFNGQVTFWIYDSPVSQTTKGNENDPFEYKSHQSFIFRGQAEVIDGRFNSTLLLPDFSQKTNYTRIQFYAVDTVLQMDASGGDIIAEIISGQSTGSDQSPPQIDIYIDDVSFNSGDVVSSDSQLFIKLKDESGIDLRHTVVPNLRAELNGETIDLTPYYLSDPNVCNSGLVTYPFYNLASGNYELIVHASDLEGNEAFKTITFQVVKDDHLAINNFSVFPNPSFGQDIFYSFQYHSSAEFLKVQVVISDISGRSVYQNASTILTKTNQIKGLLWSIADQQSISLDKGLYLYKVMLTSGVNGAYVMKSGKLVVN